jgi:hypothetical protein
MNVIVDLAAAFIVGRNDECVRRRAHILKGDFADALVAVGDLMHPALLVKIADSLPNLTPRKLLDNLLQSRIFLPDDLIELCRLHPASCNCA